MKQPIEKYVERVDELAQEVVNAWGLNTKAGSAPSFTPEFKALVDKACEYRTSKQIADNHREFNCLTEQEAVDEKRKREAFAIEYKHFHERREAAS